MTTWDEVKRLAADFQKIQLSSTTQRLSERNCVEILSWLIDRKMIDILFTADGRECLTYPQFDQEILGEIYVNNGRVNFVDAARSIGVNSVHVLNRMDDLVRCHKDVHSVLGQLIDSSYITKIANEINGKLIQQGQIDVNDLIIYYDLPADFMLQQVIEKNMGKLIHGIQDKNDPRVFFTASFVARSKAKVRGCLIGLTRPVTVAAILNQINMTEKLFFSFFDQTITYGFLTSRMSGAHYVPNVYSRTQNEWVSNFYKQNGYLEFDALSRIGISDHKTYLKKQFVNEDILQLQSCIISKQILERIEADIEESISSKSHVDVQNNLPSVLSDDDIKIILDKLLTAHKIKLVVVIDNYVISKAFIDTLAKSCESLIEERAKSAVTSGVYQQYQTDLQVAFVKSHKDDGGDNIKVDKREERRKKAASGKSGGGTQGRETKTKSVKKLYKTNKKVDNEEDDVEKKYSLDLIRFDDVKNLIQSKLEEEGLSELIENICNYLLPILNDTALKTAARIYATTVSDVTATRRNTHNDTQTKLNSLLGDIRMFEKGIKLFPNETQQSLYKYLLKTLCTDVVNEMLNYIALEVGLKNAITDTCTNEQRMKFAVDLGSEYQNSFQNVIKTLSGQNLDEFMVSAEEGLTACSMILKKIDKKKDRVVILNHKHALLEQLDKCDDPALILHLASLVLFISATQNMLHASGKHVASILSFLKSYLTPEQSMELMSFYELVTVVLGGSAEADKAKDELNNKIPIIKAIANDYKKSGTTADGK